MQPGKLVAVIAVLVVCTATGLASASYLEAEGWNLPLKDTQNTGSVDRAVPVDIHDAVIKRLNLSGDPVAAAAANRYLYVLTDDELLKLNASRIDIPTGSGEQVSLQFLNASDTKDFLQGASHTIQVSTGGSFSGELRFSLESIAGDVLDSGTMQQVGDVWEASVDVPMEAAGQYVLGVWSDTGRFETISLPEASPEGLAVTGSHVYYTAGSVYQLDEEDLSQAAVSEESGYYTPPMVTDQYVYVMHDGDTGYALHQLSASDVGSLTASNQDVRMSGPPVVAGDDVFAYNLSGGVLKLDAGDISTVKEEIMLPDESGSPTAAPVVSDAFVYISSAGNVTQLWRDNLSIRDWFSVDDSSSPQVLGGDDGLLYYRDNVADQLTEIDEEENTRESVTYSEDFGTFSGIDGFGSIFQGSILAGGGENIVSFDRDPLGSYTSRQLLASGSSMSGVFPAYDSVFAFGGSKAFQLSAPASAGSWHMDVRFLPPYTYDDQFLVIGQLLNSNGDPVSPQDCSNVYARYRYTEDSNQHMTYMEGSEGYYYVTLQRDPSEDSVVVEGEGDGCSFGDGTTSQTVTLPDFASPGYGTLVTVNTQLEGESFISHSGNSCRTVNGTLVCEKGANISIEFQETQNTATSVSATVSGEGSSIGSTQLSSTGDGEWGGAFSIPEKLDTAEYGKRLVVNVTASNDISQTFTTNEFDINPLSVSLSTDARKQAQGNPIQLQIYPEKPYTEEAVALEEIGMFSVSITDPNGSVVASEDVGQLGPHEAQGQQALLYEYSIPSEALTGSYTFDVFIEDVYGENASSQRTFEVLDISEVCPSFSGMLCVLTTSIEEHAGSRGEHELFFSVQNLGSSEVPLTINADGNLSELVSSSTVSLGTVPQEIAVPIAVTREDNGLYQGNLVLSAGSSTERIPVSFTVDIPADRINVSARKTSFGTVLSGKTLQTKLTITNTGRTDVSSLTVTSQDTGIDTVVEKNLPLKPESSVSTTVSINTDDLLAGSRNPDIVVETDNGGEATVSLSFTIVEDQEQAIRSLQSTISSLNQSIFELGRQNISESLYQSLRSDLGQLRSQVRSADAAWSSERYEEASGIVDRAETLQSSLEKKIDEGRQALSQRQQTQSEQVQEERSGGTVMWVVLIAVLLVIGAVLYLSIVPEDQ